MRRPWTIRRDRGRSLACLALATALVAGLGVPAAGQAEPTTSAAASPSETPTPDPTRAPRPSATPTPDPTRAPRPSPSDTPESPPPTPTPDPTRRPDPSPPATLEPTATLAPTPEPTPGLLTLGATHGTFSDDFSVPGSWGVVDDDQARIDYADESLLFTFKQPGGRWTTRAPAQVSPGMRLDVDVILGPGVASAGAMCGRNGPPTDFALGAVTPSGTWGLGRMVDNVPSTLASGSLEGMDIVIGEPIRLAIECSTTETGERVAFWVDGQLVADISDDEPRGPYDRVGLYAYGGEPDSTVRFDEAYAYDAGPVPGLTTLGAETPTFTDDFSTAGDWGTFDDGTDRVAVEDGQLVISVGQAEASRWTTRQLPGASNEVRVELAVDVPADGSTAGPMCLSSDAEPIASIGVVDANDQWIVGRIVEGEFGLISTGRLEDRDVVSGVPVPVALECAVTAEGERIALWVDGRLVADVVTDLQHGPWAAVGAYADAVTPGATSRFDGAVVLSGEPAGPVSSLGADLVVFEDAFDDPSEWATGRTREARVDYANDALRIRFSRPGSVWSSQPFTEPLPVVGLEATFVRRAGGGAAGVLCARPGEPFTYYAATLDTDGEVAVHASVGPDITELARGQLPDGMVVGDRVRLKVECGVADADSDRIVVWVDGVPVMDHITSESFGSFDQVALFASTSRRRFEVRADDAVMSAGFTYGPGVAEVSTAE